MTQILTLGEVLIDFDCGRFERCPPLPVILLYLGRIMLIDAVAHSHKILGGIPGTESQLDKHALP